MTEISLRPVEDDDLDALFRQMCDPESLRMAAFTPDNATDRAAFDTRMARLRRTPEVTQRVVLRDGRVVGSVASFVVDADTEITYWIDRAVWGQGVASRALALFLSVVTRRPLHARAAADNLGSLTVLRRAGFRVIGTERSYAAARGADIEELVLRLDGPPVGART